MLSVHASSPPWENKGDERGSSEPASCTQTSHMVTREPLNLSPSLPTTEDHFPVKAGQWVQRSRGCLVLNPIFLLAWRQTKQMVHYQYQFFGVFFYLHYKKLIPSGPKKLNLRQGVKSCTDEVRNSPCSEAMQERLGTGTQKERNKAHVQNRYMQHQHINVIS